MSAYSLSGSGTHALTTNTTGLQVTITTSSSIGGLGRSNPVAKYSQGLIRFSDGTAYWAPVPILGGPQFIPVPANATSFGYALLGGAGVDVVEVIGGTVFFSGGAQTLETLSDVQIAAIADAQVLAWNAAAGKWENVAPSVPSAAALASYNAKLGSNVSVPTPGTWVDILSHSFGAGTWFLSCDVEFTIPTQTDCEAKLWDGSTVYASADTTMRVGTDSVHVHFDTIAVLGVTTTLKISAAANAAAVTVLAAMGANAAGNNATQLTAIQLA